MSDDAGDGHEAADRFGSPEADPFHDYEGRSTLGAADPTEVAQFAHDCYIAGVDPDETATFLKAR